MKGMSGDTLKFWVLKGFKVFKGLWKCTPNSFEGSLQMHSQ